MMRRTVRDFLIILAITVGLGAPLMVWADPAGAQTATFTFEGSDFLIPRPAERAPVGELRLVATYDVVANGYEEYIGTTCTFVVTAANGVSVHGNNQGYLVTNGSSTDVLQTENEPNALRTVLDDPTLQLGATVQLYNIIGEWAEGDNIREGFVGTSVDYEVTATCTIEDDTTTTTSSSSTTSSSTSTTTPPPTTSIPPTSSTTSTLPATSTTAPTGSSTTTQPPNTSTTAPNGSTSTTAPTVSTSSIIEQDTTTTIGTGSTLPFTGPPVGTVGLTLAGMALLLLGGAVLVAGRES